MTLAAPALALLAASCLAISPVSAQTPVPAQTAVPAQAAASAGGSPGTTTAQAAGTPPATQAPAAQMAPTTAKAPPSELSQIETMVSNLGYTPKTGGAGTWFTIEYAARNNYRIDFSLSPDKSVLYIYITYGITAAQLAVLPGLVLLQWNDSHRDYFSVSKDKTQISLNVNMPTQSLTPKSLRQAIGQLAGDADGADKIFYPGNW